MRRALVLFVLLLVASSTWAQASGVQFSSVVCGPSGLSGVTYVNLGGRPVACGTDSSGASLVLQVSTLTPDTPVEGGEQTGLDIGAAVLLVMGAAFCFRSVRRLLESGGDGA